MDWSCRGEMRPVWGHTQLEELISLPCVHPPVCHQPHHLQTKASRDANVSQWELCCSHLQTTDGRLATQGSPCHSYIQGPFIAPSICFTSAPGAPSDGLVWHSFPSTPLHTYKPTDSIILCLECLSLFFPSSYLLALYEVISKPLPPQSYLGLNPLKCNNSSIECLVLFDPKTMWCVKCLAGVSNVYVCMKFMRNPRVRGSG